MCRGLITVENSDGIETVLNPAAILAIVPRGYDSSRKHHVSAVIVPNAEILMRGTPRQVLAAIRFLFTAQSGDDSAAAPIGGELEACNTGGAADER